MTIHMEPIGFVSTEADEVPFHWSRSDVVGRLMIDEQYLAGITDIPGRQLALFDFGSEGRARLDATLDQLSARFGPDAFRLAVLADPDNLLPERRASWPRWRAP